MFSTHGEYAMPRVMQTGLHKQRHVTSYRVHSGEQYPGSHAPRNWDTLANTYHPSMACTSDNNLLFASPCVAQMCIAHDHTCVRICTHRSAPLQMGSSCCLQWIGTRASTK